MLGVFSDNPDIDVPDSPELTTIVQVLVLQPNKVPHGPPGKSLVGKGNFHIVNHIV